MKHVGIKDFNEAEVLTILEQLKICSSLNNQGLVVVEESDSSNMDNLKKGPFHFLFNEDQIHTIMCVVFQQADHSANSMADALNKVGGGQRCNSVCAGGWVHLSLLCVDVSLFTLRWRNYLCFGSLCFLNMI